MLHVRAGVEEMEAKIRLDGKNMFQELAAKLDEAVPQLIEEKLANVSAAFEEL
jgi:hypothetical protein